MAAAYEDRILRVLAHIHDNPAGDLSLDALADVAAMSRFHWHRVFKALTGETCAQTVRRMRLHLGAARLIKSDLPFEAIAPAVGYPNPASFARAFSEAYGMSPAAFRKAGRLMPVSPQFRTGDYPMHPIEIRHEPARRLAMLAHQGPYEEIGRSFEAFGAICQSRSLWPHLGPMMAIYLDSPETVPAHELRSFAGAAWTGNGMPEGLAEQHLPGGKTAVLTCKGPYSGISPAYDTLFGNWLPQSGEEPGDTPCFEIYLNNPREVPPEELLTEICLPLK